MSRNNNNAQPRVQVVLPPGTASIPPLDPKTQKQNLKNRISVLKSQQKETTKQINSIQKELNKLSKPALKKQQQQQQKKK